MKQRGSNVVTVKGPSVRWGLRKGEYRYLCWDKNGAPHRGEKHKKKV